MPAGAPSDEVDAGSSEGASLPRSILIWFALALILITAPPLHWVLGGSLRVLGLPIALAYLFGAGLFATASVAAAYFVDPSRGKA